ncbi:L-threonylcarbamoyladenylate synthase [Methanimicrococcus blatticola]|uniref:L-threonylcarbamoyladenylate synthase n=1 Tax=Methanimicrococcus blatticola TaxID=91560 RepID=A0A484F2A1_9EURY|nr:L-threonylcarbamoyladenylate synthase [Methanimicrococcus blatticola]MBZ3936401.1 threonylcarbamoyl-AMP synthase [Methanimicrococcus blatticola]MCC2509563.1 threonylcarbamoyl-AMP synthase [Methanimicrococcus blatticola]TDQ67613.1 tRNA threonylcarbamoyl adenosine modification protein (Sua5/YciO/YrdC/YwlC family) [Methanimicrococcus blatticola]
MPKTEIYALEDFETAVQAAADALITGKIAAFPTETVYGLGACISNENAVLKIYQAKGRIPEKPLSVLISSAEDMKLIAEEIPKEAQKLAEAFWPGPMTIILKKKANISDKITAGRETVGLRVPAHPAAIEIVRRAGPLACPSANKSDGKEPKSAADVLADLDGKIDLLIDGGETEIQKPSTIIDLTVTPPKILRKGGLDIPEIVKCIGEVL